MRSRPSGSELALRNRGIATGALRRSCSHSSRHFEPRYYREQKEESQCIWTRSEAVLEKELWIIFFSRYVAQDPMLTGILQVGQLPPQCTFSIGSWATYLDRKSTRLNSSHVSISYAVF